MSSHAQAAGVDLAALFVNNRARLRRIANAIVGSSEWADDVVHDAYMKLLAAQTAVVVSQPLAYCCQVVRNMARDHQRRAAFESQLLTCEEDGEHVASSHGQPERQAMRRQNFAILDAALDRVPARTRLAYEMHVVRGMTQRDIASALALSLGLVNALIAEATDVLTEHEHLMAWD